MGGLALRRPTDHIMDGDRRSASRPTDPQGFGSRLIHALSASLLGAKVQFDFDICGVNCIIVVPLESGWSDHGHSPLRL